MARTYSLMADLLDFNLHCTALPEHNSGRATYSVGWHDDDFRYHVWLYPSKDGGIARPDMIFKNRQEPEHHARNGGTTYLYDKVEKNHVVIDEILKRCTPSALSVAQATKRESDRQYETDQRVKRIESITRQARDLGFRLVPIAMRCNKCHRPMDGSTAYDGACECGGLIEATSEI